MSFKSLGQLVLVLLAMPVIGNAQVRETLLQGQVIDASGNAVAAARLLVVNLDTLEEQRLVVKANGKFALPQMTPGDYEVIAAAPAESPCFRSVAQRVQLDLDTTRSLKLVMLPVSGGCGAAK